MVSIVQQSVHATSAGKEMSWLNFMVAKMWPHIHEALKLVVANDLEPKIKADSDSQNWRKMAEVDDHDVVISYRVDHILYT